MTLSKDEDLELLTARKMRELRRSISEKKKPKNTDRDLVVSKLVDRGVEVLVLAESRYRTETEEIVKKIAGMIRKRVLVGSISGGELLSVFRRLGMNINVKTTINIEDSGRFVSFAEKMKSVYD